MWSAVPLTCSMFLLNGILNVRKGIRTALRTTKATRKRARTASNAPWRRARTRRVAARGRARGAMCERVLLPWHAAFRLESDPVGVDAPLLPALPARLLPPVTVAPLPLAPAPPPEALPPGSWCAAHYAWDPHTLVRRGLRSRTHAPRGEVIEPNSARYASPCAAPPRHAAGLQGRTRRRRGGAGALAAPGAGGAVGWRAGGYKRKGARAVPRGVTSRRA
jgi:hypothetical protein